jgi:nicotinamide-nucleotide amidase
MKKTKIVKEIGKLCKKYHLTIVTSESCTGGGIAYAISKSHSCSPFLERGYITYSNQAKEKVLHVKTESIQFHGAVSEIVAKEMAEGALQESLAQVSLSVTGLAGEDKVDNKKGEAWIGISMIDSKTKTYKIDFTGKRFEFIKFVIEKSLEFLYKTIKENLK